MRYTHGMSKRLQVLFDEPEFEELRGIAQRHGMTVSAWVRQVIRAARRRESDGDPAAKLEAIRVGAAHRFPTADIDVVLAETERGYLAGSESAGP